MFSPNQIHMITYQILRVEGSSATDLIGGRPNLILVGLTKDLLD